MNVMSSPEKITVHIDSSTIIRVILFVVGFWMLFLLQEVVLVVLAAVVIASSLEPPARWLERQGIPRIIGLIFIYLMLAVGLASLIYFVIPPLLVDLQDVLAQAPEYIRSIQLGEEAGLLGEVGLTDGSVGSLSLIDLVRELRLSLIGESFNMVSFLLGTFGGVIGFILIVTISFYLAVQRNGIANFLRIVTPVRHEEYVIDLWQRSQQKIGRWLQGQLVLMLVVGVLTYLGLTILGVPNALLLGIVAAVTEIIPLFGSVIGAIPAVVIALAHGGLSLGLLVVGLFVIIQQFESNLIHPLVVTKVVGVPPIIVIISLVIGGQLAGFLGVLLSVPIAAIILEAVNDYEHYKKVPRSRESDASAQ